MDTKMQTTTEEKTALPGVDAESTHGEAFTYSRAVEKRVLRKLDLHLGPLFGFLYFISYLDRSNIGNAGVAGMTADLGITSAQFSTAASIFYATYVSFEIPVTMAMKRLHPHRYIAVMVLAWSAITVSTAFVKSYGSLLAVRLILGACESGFFPCMSLYISMAYKREEQGLRVAYLFSSAALSGMFGGLIATGITNINEHGQVARWGWLYIIEGLVSFFAIFWVFFGLPDDPARAKWWNEEERRVMEARDAERQEYLGSQAFEWSDIWAAIKDPKIYFSSLIQFFQDIILYGFSTFLPSILKLGLGFSSLQAQYLSVPVYLLGGLSFLTAAILGDKYRIRGPLILGANIFALIGYAILLGVSNNAVKYFACYLIAVPLYIGPGINDVWNVNNNAPHYKRAMAIGMQQTIANTAGLVAPQVYRASPYLLGHWCSMGAVLLSSCVIVIQISYLHMLNRRKDRLERDMVSNGVVVDQRTEKERQGEGAFGFRYIL